jgi:hypothetical protein
MTELEMKINTLFTNIITSLKTFLASSNNEHYIYDILTSIYTYITTTLTTSNHLAPTLITQCELIQQLQNENKKYKEQEIQLMQFEKDILYLINNNNNNNNIKSSNSKETSLKRIAYQAKLDIKKLKEDFKIKELNYLMKIKEQYNTIKEHKIKNEKLQKYIRENLSQLNKDLSKKSMLFPHLYDKVEREEVNALKKIKTKKKLFTSHSIGTLGKRKKHNGIKNLTLYIDKYPMFSSQSRTIESERSGKNKKIRDIKRYMGNKHYMTSNEEEKGLN